ncbi:exodeoxyribonuclease VII large subunit [Mucisphaera sp.]|uniref:exodeoxyribonuclease VII large subunit n=1 Tax=Mucisphaera sp. TaxID=2913024 RepID=UPI003D151A15
MAAGEGEGDAPLTVTQAAGLVQRTVQRAFPGRVRIHGEIGSLSQRNHWYFNLKDEGATLRCACFANRVRGIRFRPENGMAVVASGRLDFYPPQGSLQLIVETMEPAGEGALEAELRRRVAELRELGYFDEGRKRSLPAVPTRVAVVTSGAGAALQDVIDTTRQRWPGCQLVLVDVPVQGAAAAPAVSRALRVISDRGPKLGLDAVILTRGGGSMEDLWAFNERSIADAVFECSLPVVAAIGHEVDTTIAELVADVRAATPTQAAMRLVPDREALAHQLDQLGRQLRMQTERRMESLERRLEQAARASVFRRPEVWVGGQRERVAALTERLRLAVRQGAGPHRQRLARTAEAMERVVGYRVASERQALEALSPRLFRAADARFERAAERFYALARQLEAVGPQQVLARGYTYTLGTDGKPLRSVEAARAVGRLRTVFGDGEVVSRVEGEAGETTVSVRSGGSRSKKRSTKPKADDSGGLFG